MTEEQCKALAARRFKEGQAVVDMKFNEVFCFSLATDARVVTEWPGKFREATKEEEDFLRESGGSSVAL